MHIFHPEGWGCRHLRNADDQLVANVKEVMEENPDLKVYFVKGDFKGLKGYYTSGVIEGAWHCDKAPEIITDMNGTKLSP
jgi:hypothetical protein